MSTDTLALMIPIVALMIPIVAILSKSLIAPLVANQERKATTSAAMTAGSHTERLEQRVRVLERIVTDRGMDLSGEIERLRSLPDVPPTRDF